MTAGPAYLAGDPGEPAEGGETEETSATFEFEANIADATFRCSLDLGPFVECASPISYTGLAVGDHVFRVYAIDSEGAEQLEATEYGWTILAGLDLTPPQTAISTTGDPTDPATGAAVFAFGGTDNVTSPQGLAFECSLVDPLDAEYEASFAACASPWMVPNPEAPEPLAAGTHVFSVRAIDVEDNIDPTPATLAFAYDGDTEPPSVSIIGTARRDDADRGQCTVHLERPVRDVRMLARRRRLRVVCLAARRCSERRRRARAARASRRSGRQRR